MISNANPNPINFLDTAIKRHVPSRTASSIKVLDFGCGKGNLVKELSSLRYDANGCDIDAYWEKESEPETDTLSRISLAPYRLPFENGTFDVVVSTSVLEHAQNKEECFKEIHRVLKSGGYAMHLYPGKWYLPYEPHIYVPFVNMLWPTCPKWWLSFCAKLGVRNEFQQGKSWKEVVDLNTRYCELGLSYWSNRKYYKLSQKVYGNYSAPMKFYINHANGGAAKFFRRFPAKGLWGWLIGNIRMNFIVLKKTD
jgi:SAM-dependent methyltransferase